ncbi:MAG TPA: hypothetical protein VNM66_09880, partial [Thermodesulfobacteriota bacterium]|nr:hypothetical protein [Thermodesulfobacteriota bacterium]
RADLPVVTGLDVRALAADPAGQTARVAAGVRLVGLVAARAGLEVSELHLDPVRGYLLRAAWRPAAGGTRAPLTVVIGEEPFEPKLERLARVLAYLAAAGAWPESVDLSAGRRAYVRLRAPAWGRDAGGPPVSTRSG